MSIVVLLPDEEDPYMLLLLIPVSKSIILANSALLNFSMSFLSIIINEEPGICVEIDLDNGS